MAHNYTLQVTAGPSYDITTHQIVPVNTGRAVRVENEECVADVNVRIQSYRGLPLNSPPSSPYFSLPPHNKSKDQYSISFTFTPKKPINGNDLVFGNDFDHPIRDRLPPGFGTAFRIVKYFVDPGLDGDVYAEKPYLYGPAGSSVNGLWVGGKKSEGKDEKGEGGEEEVDEVDEDTGRVVTEGGSEEGMEWREEVGMPESDAARKKWFLNEETRKGFEWEKGRSFGCDFYNPYLDFNDFALRLPGFTLPIMKYWDGQGLRYVLKNRATDEVLFVVLFTLYLKEDVKSDGTLVDGVEGGKPLSLMSDKERGKHERAVGGGGEGGGDEDGDEEGKEGKEGDKGQKEEEGKGQHVGGRDDDLD